MMTLEEYDEVVREAERQMALAQQEELGLS